MKGLAAVVLLVAMVVCLRLFCIASYRISTDSMNDALVKGDRILVDKLPLKENPGRNRVVLFHSPLLRDTLEQPLFVSRCVGMPGDTIRVPFLEESYNLVIPRKDRAYRLDEASLIACRDAILLEAGDQAAFREGKLYLDGRETTFFFFRQDYYWMLSDNPNEAIDSRHLGVIPADHIVGNAFFCWYSTNTRHLFKPVR